MKKSQKVKEVFLFPFKLVLYIPVYFYKFCISPLLPKVCKFTPTCSTYFLNAVKSFGAAKGTYLGIRRILKCNHKSSGGFDPVPVNIRGEAKWIL